MESALSNDLNGYPLAIKSGGRLYCDVKNFPAPSLETAPCSPTYVNVKYIYIPKRGEGGDGASGSDS
ncbi:hypothetical protein HYPGJ_10617 [Hyphomicrobium sp. GJ21]|nr:hypothetical protein HYPGJ_10617 [Hyphomicrobium sp. GJ21]